MPRLTPVAWHELVQRLRELGFQGPYAGGRHPQMRRDEVTVIIPNPHEGDIGVGLLRRILRQAAVSRKEYNHKGHKEHQEAGVGKGCVNWAKRAKVLGVLRVFAVKTAEMAVKPQRLPPKPLPG